MTQYNTLNLKLSNLQLNKLKLGIKNSTEVTNFVGDSNDENKFLLTNTQVSNLCKAFSNGFSGNIKLSKSQ